MDVDFQISNDKFKMIELEANKDKQRKKKKTLVRAEESLQKIVEDKINGKLGMC